MRTAIRPIADPRATIVVEGPSYLIEGCRCEGCGNPIAVRRPVCPRCAGVVRPARFGPGGVVWSYTVVHIPAEPGGEAPYVLGYVDLDDGPRVLLRLDRAPRGVGDRVQLTAPSDTGNPAGQVV
jgi:uncharacterized protein